MEPNSPQKAFPYRDLSIHSLSIRLRVEQEVVLPSYKGSTYRGLLGHALMDAYCPLRQEACAQCTRRDLCPYPNLFKPHILQPDGGVPAPYLVDPSFDRRTWLRKGDELDFVLRLFGSALNWLPFVLAALCWAGHRGALGSRRARFAMVEPSPPEKATEPSAWGAIVPQGLRSVLAYDLLGASKNISGLRVLSPLKLKEKGAIKGEIEGDTLLKAVERRLKALHRFCVLDSEKRRYVWDNPPLLHLGKVDLRWVVLERPSCTQAERVNIGGWVGTLAVEEHNEQAALLLTIGQWTHVGKNTVYGCGKYRLVPSGRDGVEGTEHRVKGEPKINTEDRVKSIRHSAKGE